jgi:hypothetical protein
MVTKVKATSAVVRKAAAPVEVVSEELRTMRALTPLRIHGQDVAEGEDFEVEAELADTLSDDGLAEAVPTETAPQ